MKQIEITKEDEELISGVIAKIIHHHAKNEKIDAIYMNAYNEEKIRNYNPNLRLRDQVVVEPNIHIVLIYNDFLEAHAIYDYYDDMQVVRLATGVNLNIIDKPSRNYNPKNMDTRNFLACRELANGTLLFDREGKFTTLQNSLLKIPGSDNQKSFIAISDPYQDAIEFNPPLQLKK